jgi:hypothetical protein
MKSLPYVGWWGTFADGGDDQRRYPISAARGLMAIAADR